MSALRDRSHGDPSITGSVCMSPARSVIEHVHDAAFDAVVWERTPDAALIEALERCALDGAPLRRSAVGECQERPAIAAFATSLVEALPEALRGPIGEDIVDLCQVVATISGARRIHGSFGLITGDECTKFHQDYLRLRLLVTYVGPGTLLVDRAAVDVHALEHPVEDSDTCNQRIVRDLGRTVQAPRAAVVLLKGAAWPGMSHGAVHRSPTISRTGARRIVLALSVSAHDEPPAIVTSRTERGQRVWLFPEDLS
jgi:Asp/Glu/hydantoin racemase